MFFSNSNSRKLISILIRVSCFRRGILAIKIIVNYNSNNNSNKISRYKDIVVTSIL